MPTDPPDDLDEHTEMMVAAEISGWLVERHDNDWKDTDEAVQQLAERVVIIARGGSPDAD